MRAVLAATWPLLVLGLPEAARACSVCGFGEDGSRTAYLAMTAVMSVLPVAIFFGFVLYVRRRLREIEAQQRAEAGAALPASPERRTA